MPFEKATLAELGRTERCRDEYRAHLQFRTETGSKTNIHGPCRTTEHEAQKDLVQIRAAGSIGATRKDGLKLMETEAKSIKISAAYQAQIQDALHRMSSKDLPNESDDEYDDDASGHSEPPYLKSCQT